MKYKVGDRVRVVGNCSWHRFNLGDEVMIFEHGQSAYWCRKVIGGPYFYCYESDLAPIEEPAATIQAIREATERHTTSPEAARKALIEAGIVKHPVIALAEEVLKAHIERNTDFKFDNIMEVEGTVNTLAKCGLSAMQEYADLQTASLQAEKAELLEALREVASGGQEALDYEDGSGKPILQEAIWKAEAVLSKLQAI